MYIGVTAVCADIIHINIDLFHYIHTFVYAVNHGYSEHRYSEVLYVMKLIFSHCQALRHFKAIIQIGQCFIHMELMVI